MCATIPSPLDGWKYPEIVNPNKSFLPSDTKVTNINGNQSQAWVLGALSKQVAVLSVSAQRCVNAGRSLPHSSLLACYLPLLLPIAVCPCLDLFLFSCPALIVCFLLFFLSAKPTVLKWLYSWAPKVKKNPKSLLSSLPQSLCLYSAPSLLSYQLEVSMLINFMLHISLVAEDGLWSQVACC